jgi:hypothetical protein
MCAVFVAFASTICAAQTRTKLAVPEIDSDLPVIQSPSPATRECGKAEWNLLNLRSTTALLADYGFGNGVPWMCKAAVVPWSETEQVLRLTATRGLDDYPEVTLVRASASSRVWLIPVYAGMVGYANAENDPHNRAAFNDLLRVSHFVPRNDQLTEVCDLYQFLVGREVRLDPSGGPKTVRELISTSDLPISTEHGKDSVTLTHRERFGDRFQAESLVWEFVFVKKSEHFYLSDVSRETLEEYEPEN